MEAFLIPAIIITGEMRSFDVCLPNLWWSVFRHFPDAHVFVSTVKDDNSHKAGLLRKHFSNVTIEEVDKQPDFPELKPWTPGQFYTHEPYAISVSPTAVLRQLWQLEQGWNLYKKSGLKADVIIRCRPDLWFHDEDMNSALGETLCSFRNTCLAPNWGRFGGVNDRFAIMGSYAAKCYFTTFSNHQKLIQQGCPLHPESLVAASLEESKTVVRIYNFLFSTVRTNGEFRPPEIIPSDFLK